MYTLTTSKIVNHAFLWLILLAIAGCNSNHQDTSDSGETVSGYNEYNSSSMPSGTAYWDQRNLQFRLVNDTNTPLSDASLQLLESFMPSGSTHSASNGTSALVTRSLLDTFGVLTSVGGLVEAVVMGQQSVSSAESMRDTAKQMDDQSVAIEESLSGVSSSLNQSETINNHIEAQQQINADSLALVSASVSEFNAQLAQLTIDMTVIDNNFIQSVQTLQSDLIDNANLLTLSLENNVFYLIQTRVEKLQSRLNDTVGQVENLWAYYAVLFEDDTYNVAQMLKDAPYDMYDHYDDQYTEYKNIAALADKLAGINSSLSNKDTLENNQTAFAKNARTYLNANSESDVSQYYQYRFSQVMFNLYDTLKNKKDIMSLIDTHNAYMVSVYYTNWQALLKLYILETALLTAYAYEDTNNNSGFQWSELVSETSDIPDFKRFKLSEIGISPNNDYYTNLYKLQKIYDYRFAMLKLQMTSRMFSDASLAYTDENSVVDASSSFPFVSPKFIGAYTGSDGVTYQGFPKGAWRNFCNVYKQEGYGDQTSQKGYYDGETIKAECIEVMVTRPPAFFSQPNNMVTERLSRTFDETCHSSDMLYYDYNHVPAELNCQ